MRADVEIGHGCCPAARGIDREAAGKAERIQHAPSARQHFHRAPVFPLVEEESGLLPAHNIGLKTHAVLGKNHRAVRC